MRAPHATTRAERAQARKAARRGRNFGIDAPRLRRLRIIWALVLAIPLLLLALGVLRLTSMPLVQAWALSAYSNGEYDTAGDRLWAVEKVNLFEPYLPHLTRGTAQLKDGKYSEARASLEESLAAWEAGKDLNQPAHAMCVIRTNLAVAMTGEAQSIEDPAKRADALYAAEEVLAPCASGGSGSGSNENQEQSDSNAEEIQEQREQADREAGNEERESPTDSQGGGDEDNPENDPQRTDPNGEGQDGQTPTPDPGEQKREEELEDRNNSNGSGGESDEGETDENKGVTKPW